MTLNLLDVVLLAAVGAAVFFAVRSTLRSFKNGKCPGCGGCDGCGGNCEKCTEKCKEKK